MTNRDLDERLAAVLKDIERYIGREAEKLAAANPTVPRSYIYGVITRRCGGCVCKIYEFLKAKEK
jgi:hypothetical protein